MVDRTFEHAASSTPNYQNPNKFVASDLIPSGVDQSLSFPCC